MEECKRNIKWSQDSIESNKKAKIAGTSKSEESIRSEVSAKVYGIRHGILTFIQVVVSLMMLAVTAYSFKIFITAMKLAGVEMGLYIFFGLIHGVVCLALIIAFNLLINAMK